MFCTDTWFGSTPAISGYTCAQLYYGIKSKFIALYPMIAESQGPESLEDFCRDRGVPIKLKKDRAQMEVGKAWTSICRKYNIEQCTTEAHMPWQNEAERYIQEVKKMVNIIMDCTGCPNSLSTTFIYIFPTNLLFGFRDPVPRLQRKIGEVCWNCSECGRCSYFLDLD